MVVAGVYLVARLFSVYQLEYSAVMFITVVGAVTAFYAAAVACTQIDIKRVLAFSTISQIAFLMVGLGVAGLSVHATHDIHYAGLGYMASMFHLFTHALFNHRRLCRRHPGNGRGVRSLWQNRPAGRA